MKYVVVDKLTTSLMRLHQYNKQPLFLGVLLPGDTASRGAGDVLMMAYIRIVCPQINLSSTLIVSKKFNLDFLP